MATSSKDDLRDEGLRRVLALVDGQQGVYATKSQQDAAFTALIRSANLQRFDSRTKKQLRQTTKDLRRDVLDAIREYQKPTSGGEARKRGEGINDFFAKGSVIFQNVFLQSLDYERQGADDVVGPMDDAVTSIQPTGRKRKSQDADLDHDVMEGDKQKKPQLGDVGDYIDQNAEVQQQLSRGEINSVKAGPALHEDEDAESASLSEDRERETVVPASDESHSICSETVDHQSSPGAQFKGSQARLDQSSPIPGRSTPAKVVQQPPNGAQHATESGQYRTGMDLLDIQSALKNKVFHSIQTATSLYFEQKGYDERESADFALSPNEELEALYVGFIGTRQWKARLLDLAEREHPCRLRAKVVLQGLISVAVYTQVFQKPLPWDMTHSFGAVIGEGAGYITAALAERGHDLTDVLKHASFKQINDTGFLSTTVDRYATQLAENVALSLGPHLARLTPIAEPPEHAKCQWVDDLKDVFMEALQLKHRMESARHTTYRFYWFNGDLPFERGQMASLFKVTSPVSIYATMFPGVQASIDGADMLISPALVLASAAVCSGEGKGNAE